MTARVMVKGLDASVWTAALDRPYLRDRERMREVRWTHDRESDWSRTSESRWWTPSRGFAGKLYVSCNLPHDNGGVGEVSWDALSMRPADLDAFNRPAYRAGGGWWEDDDCDKGNAMLAAAKWAFKRGWVPLETLSVAALRRGGYPHADDGDPDIPVDPD